jgi:hypothetical protein
MIPKRHVSSYKSGDRRIIKTGDGIESGESKSVVHGIATKVIDVVSA